MALEFRQQLTYGAPSAADEEGVQRLRSQLLLRIDTPPLPRHPQHHELVHAGQN